MEENYYDDEIEYFTKDEAESRARQIAIRDLQISESKISCIAFADFFSDYALVEYLKEPEGWIETFTSLPNRMRLENEIIQDSKIKSVADSGDLISAIRLYRTKYEVGLLEAKNAIEKMQK